MSNPAQTLITSTNRSWRLCNPPPLQFVWLYVSVSRIIAINFTEICCCDLGLPMRRQKAPEISSFSFSLRHDPTQHLWFVRSLLQCFTNLFTYLLSFWWWSGPRYGFQIIFHFPQHSIIKRFRKLSKMLMPTRERIQYTAGVIRQTLRSIHQSRNPDLNHRSLLVEVRHAGRRMLSLSAI